MAHEPKGLSMSLEDIIKESSNNEDRGKNSFSKARSGRHNFDGNRGNKFYGGKPFQQFDRNDRFGATEMRNNNYNNNANSNILSVQYSWEKENEDEVFVAKLHEKLLCKATSSGTVVVGNEIPHDSLTFKAYNCCLRPLGLRLFFDGNLKLGDWLLCKPNTTWRQQLNRQISISAFARRDWLGIKQQLESLPEFFGDFSDSGGGGGGYTQQRFAVSVSKPPPPQGFPISGEPHSGALAPMGGTATGSVISPGAAPMMPMFPFFPMMFPLMQMQQQQLQQQQLQRQQQQVQDQQLSHVSSFGEEVHVTTQGATDGAKSQPTSGGSVKKTSVLSRTGPKVT